MNPPTGRPGGPPPHTHRDTRTHVSARTRTCKEVEARLVARVAVHVLARQRAAGQRGVRQQRHIVAPEPKKKTIDEALIGGGCMQSGCGAHTGCGATGTPALGMRAQNLSHSTKPPRKRRGGCGRRSRPTCTSPLGPSRRRCGTASGSSSAGVCVCVWVCVWVCVQNVRDMMNARLVAWREPAHKRRPAPPARPRARPHLDRLNPGQAQRLGRVRKLADAVAGLVGHAYVAHLARLQGGVGVCVMCVCRVCAVCVLCACVCDRVRVLMGALKA